MVLSQGEGVCKLKGRLRAGVQEFNGKAVLPVLYSQNEADVEKIKMTVVLVLYIP
jgi:hypothetical protein